VKAAAEKRTSEGVLNMDCAVCGKPMKKWRSQVKRAKWAITCSPECRSESMSGANNVNWLGGTWIERKTGYRFLQTRTLAPEDQALLPVSKPRDVVEHRLVMARSLGRWPTPQEHIHHVNGDKADNRPENLEILGADEHSREHRAVLRKLAEVQAENRSLRAALAKLAP